MYILIITYDTVTTNEYSYSTHFKTRTVYGPFDSIEDIKEWIKDKFNNSSYSIDIYPLIDPSQQNIQD